jgi:hypothetical protein
MEEQLIGHCKILCKLGGGLLRLVASAMVCGSLLAIRSHFPGVDQIAFAQAAPPVSQDGAFELEESLFVQDPHMGGGQAGMQVLWIPQPIQKYCLGKTAKECIAIDYCIRTTSKNASMCENLSPNLRRLPPYPPGIRPKRVLSVVYFLAAPIKGIAALQKFFESAPKGSLDHLSSSLRIKAKIKMSRSSEDDQFELLEVLAVPH